MNGLVLRWGGEGKGKKRLKPISWYLDSSHCYLSISRVFVTPSPLVDHTAPTAPHFISLALSLL